MRPGEDCQPELNGSCVSSEPPRLRRSFVRKGFAFPREFLHFREGQRPDLCQPRPTAWVRIQKIIKALKGRPNSAIPLVECNFAGWRLADPSGLAVLSRLTQAVGRPLAWADIVRPFGAKKGGAFPGKASLSEKSYFARRSLPTKSRPERQEKRGRCPRFPNGLVRKHRFYARFIRLSRLWKRGSAR